MITMKTEELAAKDIMNPNLITVRDDMTVHGLSELLTEKMISGAPVMNAEGKLVGVVSHTDIIRQNERRDRFAKDRKVPEYYEAPNYYLHGWEGRINPEDFNALHVEEDDGYLVRDIMTPMVFEVDQDTPIGEVADRMLRGRIHRLLVTRRGQAVGIITTMDMLKAIAT